MKLSHILCVSHILCHKDSSHSVISDCHRHCQDWWSYCSIAAEIAGGIWGNESYSKEDALKTVQGNVDIGDYLISRDPESKKSELGLKQ